MDSRNHDSVRCSDFGELSRAVFGDRRCASKADSIAPFTASIRGCPVSTRRLQHPPTPNLLFAFAFLLLIAAAGVVSADMQQLKRELTGLERAVSNAETRKSAVDKALQENLNAQRNARGDDLARLKREAIALSARAHEAGESLRTARRNLASKQGELRTEASNQATRQLSADGALDLRVAEARKALAEWKSALGDLPQAPQPRDLSGVDDELKEAFLKTDIDRLKAYESWASAEGTRIDGEIRAAERLIAWKVNDAADGAKLTAEARALKATLETRRKNVQAAANSAENVRKRLERAG